MTSLERASRLVVFFAGFAALVAWTGLCLLPVRLLALVRPQAAARVVRRWTVRWNRWLLRWSERTARVRVTIEGAPPPGAGHVIVSNHQSLADISILIATFAEASPLFVLKRELRYGVPNISPGARLGGHAIVSRRRVDRRQFDEIGRLGARLEPERVSAVIFPEGTRSRDGTLGPFKAGGLAALLRAAPRAAVVPVAIDGSWRASELEGLFRNAVGLEIRVRIGEPIRLESGAADETGAREMTARCREFCEQALREWRGEVVVAEPARQA